MISEDQKDQIKKLRKSPKAAGARWSAALQTQSELQDHFSLKPALENVLLKNASNLGTNSGDYLGCRYGNKKKKLSYNAGVLWLYYSLQEKQRLRTVGNQTAGLAAAPVDAGLFRVFTPNTELIFCDGGGENIVRPRSLIRLCSDPGLILVPAVPSSPSPEEGTCG